MIPPIVPLGELCDMDRRGLRSDDPDAARLPLLGVENVGSGTGTLNLNAGSRVGDGKSTSFRFDERHVLYAKLRPYLNKVATPEFAGRCSTELVPLLPRRGVDRDFLAYLLRRKETVALVMSSVTGSRMPRADMNALMSMRVPLPPLEEQRRIVDILNRAARIETLRTQAAERLREFVPALFVKMFGDPGDSRNGWDVCRLGDAIQGFQGGRNISAGHGETRFRVLKVSAVTDGIFNPRMSKPVPDGYVPPDNHLVREGDLLISRANTSRLVGATAMVEHPTPNVLLPDKIWRFVWRDDSTIEPIYMDSLFKHASVRAALSKMATGTSGSMKNISQSKLKTLPIPLPPLALQRRYAETVKAARAVARVAESSTTVAAILMASLTSELLRNDVTACGMYRQEAETHG